MKPNSDKPSPRFCDYEGSDYRTAFWEGQGREYEDLAERIALPKLLPAAGERIIDIGGGFGRLADLYAGYEQIILLDHSTTQLLDARNRLADDRIIYVAANLYQAPFTAHAFDAAVMVRVLHHLSDVPGAFRAVRGFLRPGATFVLEYANKRNLKALVRHLLLGQGHNPFDQNPCEFASLNFNFHPSYVEHHLAACDFRVQRQLSVSHFRLGLLKRIVPPRLLATLDGWLQQPLAALKWTPSMFLDARAGGEPGRPLATEIFRCPSCGSENLEPHSEALGCASCGRRWSTAGGIHDFRAPLR